MATSLMEWEAASVRVNLPEQGDSGHITRGVVGCICPGSSAGAGRQWPHHSWSGRLPLSGFICRNSIAPADEKNPPPLPNNIGIFQGSALGPLLYCVFANDISQFVEDAVLVQYADDTQILVSGKKSQIQTVVARMEKVLASLDIWFRANGLKVNATKTQLMLLGSPQNLRTLPDSYLPRTRFTSHL